jgi:hypothetical protein
MAREVNYYQLAALGADACPANMRTVQKPDGGVECVPLEGPAPQGYLARIKGAATTEELSAVYNGALVDPAVSREMLKELGEAYAWKYAELTTRPGKKGLRWHHAFYVVGVALLWNAWRKSQGKPFNPFSR